MSDPRPGAQVSQRWAAWRAEVDLAEYEARWQRLAAAGQATHGEADLVASYAPRTVLDAGCGMGRVALELARRGMVTDGVDLDEDLLAVARRLGPHLRWHHADLATVHLGRRFDVVVMAGNVLLFCRPEVRSDIVANLARHLEPGGHLIAGFSLERAPGSLTLAEYDVAAQAAGLQPDQRWSTWEGAPFAERDAYAVTVFRRPSPDR